MHENIKNQDLTKQEQEEVAKLFADFAVREPVSASPPPEENEVQKEPEETPGKQISKKSRIFLFAGLLIGLTILAAPIFWLMKPRTAQQNYTFSAGNHLIAAVTKEGKVLTPSTASSLGGYVMTTQTTEVLNWDDIVSISVGTLHTLGLKNDGTVVSTHLFTPDKELPGFHASDADKGQFEVSKWGNITAVAAGYQHSVGLRRDGTVVAVGDNSCGQCEVSKWKDIIQIAAGQKHTVGLKKDGTVVSTKVPASEGDDGQCNTESWTNIVYIAASSATTIGVRKDGTVVAAGANELGQCDVATWTDIICVAAGEYQTLGLRKDGTVVSTRIRVPLATSFLPEYGQTKVSHWTDIVAVAVTNQQAFGLKSDGTVVYSGLNTAEMNEVKKWSNIQIP